MSSEDENDPIHIEADQTFVAYVWWRPRRTTHLPWSEVQPSPTMAVRWMKEEEDGGDDSPNDWLRMVVTAYHSFLEWRIDDAAHTVLMTDLTRLANEQEDRALWTSMDPNHTYQQHMRHVTLQMLEEWDQWLWEARTRKDIDNRVANSVVFQGKYCPRAPARWLGRLFSDSGMSHNS